MSEAKAPDGDAAAWLKRELGVTIEKIQPNAAAAAMALRDAQENLTAARKVIADSPTYAVAGCHDAARKAITAHMTANGLRPKSGEGSHSVVIQYAEHAMPDHLAPEQIKGLRRLKQQRNDAEYGHIDLPQWHAKRLDLAADLAQSVIDSVVRALKA